MPFVKHRCVGKSTVRITCKAKRGNWGQTTISSVSGRSAHHGIAGPITLHPFIGGQQQQVGRPLGEEAIADHPG